MRALATFAVGLKRPLHGFLRTRTSNFALVPAAPRACREKRNSIASALRAVNGPVRPEPLQGFPDQAFSVGESTTALRGLAVHRREKFDLARVVRASAHAMRLSAVEYGKCA
jgi:hypothetical protein